MASGRPIVASDLPSLREVLRHEENALLVEPGNPQALVAGIQRIKDDAALGPRLAAQARTDVRGVHVGAPRGAARDAVLQDRAGAQRDFAGTAGARPLPGLPRHAHRCRRADVRVVRQAVRRAVEGLPRSSAARDVRGADQVPRRGAPRRRPARARVAAAARLEDPQRHAARVPRARPGRSRRRSRLRQRPRAAVEPRLAGARGRHRHRPFFAHESRRRSTCCSAICAGCRSPTARSPRRYSLDVLEHLSPEALRGMLAEAARVIAPGGELFVYTHVRKNAPIAVGPAVDQRARPPARTRGTDRHAPGAPAQVGPPEPARRHPGAAPRRRRHRASASSASATTRRSSAASSRTSSMRLAEKRLARSGVPSVQRCRGADGAGAEGAECAPRSDEDALKIARAEGKQRVAQSGIDSRGAPRALGRDEAGPAAFGRVESGPFFALLERTRPRSPTSEPPTPTPMRILYSAIDQTVPAPRGDRCTSRRWRKGSRRSGTT